MKKLKFKVRFFTHNRLHNQFEYAVQCVNATALKVYPGVFFIGKDQNSNKVGFIHTTTVNLQALEYAVVGLTDEPGRKKFAATFLATLEELFDGKYDAAFDFELTYQNDEFEHTSDDTPLYRYNKTVNGGETTKVFANDWESAFSAAKYEWIKAQALDEWEDATQVNASILEDREDGVERYYVEFDQSGRWWDGTTWLSDDDVKPFFSPHYETYIAAVKGVGADVDSWYDQDWKEIYTEDGEFYNNYHDHEEALEREKEQRQDD